MHEFCGHTSASYSAYFFFGFPLSSCSPLRYEEFFNYCPTFSEANIFSSSFSYLSVSAGDICSQPSAWSNAYRRPNSPMRTMSTQACRRGGWCCGFLSSKPHSVLSPRRPPSSIPSLPILPSCPPPSGVYSRRTSPALPGPSTPPSVPPNAKFSPPPPFFPFSPSRCPLSSPPPRIRNDPFLTDGTSGVSYFPLHRSSFQWSLWRHSFFLRAIQFSSYYIPSRILITMLCRVRAAVIFWP